MTEPLDVRQRFQHLSDGLEQFATAWPLVADYGWASDGTVTITCDSMGAARQLCEALKLLGKGTEHD